VVPIFERSFVKTIALITAAGKGQRMQSPTPKQYLSLGGKPILAQTLQVFEDCSVIDGIYLIVPQDQMDMVQKEIVEKFHFKKVLKLVRGGRMRQYSVWNGLKAISAGCSIVVIHDGVRPLVNPSLIAQSIKAAQKSGAAVVAVLARDTIKRAAAGERIQTLPREEIWLAQTPQTFQFPLLMKAYQKAHQDDILGTDDAFLVERLGHPVTLVLGDHSNIKITTPEDLVLAEVLFSRDNKGK
jgi:2-C-methyl-D-erythritol 4-phosphate cytidylyltransferase